MFRRTQKPRRILYSQRAPETLRVESQVTPVTSHRIIERMQGHFFKQDAKTHRTFDSPRKEIRSQIRQADFEMTPQRNVGVILSR